MVVDSIIVEDNHKFLEHVESYTLTKQIHNLPHVIIKLLYD